MQPNQSIPSTKKRHLRKKLLLVGASIVAILAIALGTMALMSHLIPSKQETAQSKQKQAATIAKQKLEDAQDNEAKGKVDAALAAYEESLKSYQAADDVAGAEAVKLQITYMESVKESSQTTSNVVTPADPTKDPSYGTQLPR